MLKFYDLKDGITTTYNSPAFNPSAIFGSIVTPGEVAEFKGNDWSHAEKMKL